MIADLMRRDSEERERMVLSSDYSEFPLAMRLFYEVCGSRMSVSRQNRILGPDEIRTTDGKLEFAIENQGVYCWATDASCDDPPVFGRFEDSNPWVAEEPSLSKERS